MPICNTHICNSKINYSSVKNIDIRTLGCLQLSFMFSATGDGHAAVVVEVSTACHSTTADTKSSVGIDRGAVCNTAAGDGHVTIIIDRGAVRHAAVVDVKGAIGVHRGAVRHAASIDDCRFSGRDLQFVYGISFADQTGIIPAIVNIGIPFQIFYNCTG